jgi:hypothetical protein
MKRISIFAMLVVGLLTVLALIPTTSAQGAHAARQDRSSVVHVPGGAQIGPAAISTPVSELCSVNITTTSSLQNNNQYTNAASLASYKNLALFNGTVPPNTQIQPLDQWFVLGNATPGFIYTFEATPDLSGNYNLGMEIYATGGDPLTLVAQNVDSVDGPSAKLVTSFASELCSADGHAHQDTKADQYHWPDADALRRGTEQRSV